MRRMSKEEYDNLEKEYDNLKSSCRCDEVHHVIIPSRPIDVYKEVLQATQEVFGEENMTVDVMIEAIRAATLITKKIGGQYDDQ